MATAPSRVDAMKRPPSQLITARIKAALRRDDGRTRAQQPALRSVSSTAPSMPGRGPHQSGFRSGFSVFFWRKKQHSQLMQAEPEGAWP